MILPNYKNGSIVNLMSSILKAFNAKSDYAPLKELGDLDKARNIVLLVIDGLGYKYIERHGKDSIFKKHLIGSLTSVFPSTTASAIITLQTGAAPQQHGITGWYMYLKELGVVSAILPFCSRYGKSHFLDYGIRKNDIFVEKDMGDKIKNESYVIFPEEIINNKLNGKDKSVLGYNTLKGMFMQIKKAIRKSGRRKYIYAYWPKFDTFCHQAGAGSVRTKKHFEELDKKLASFVKSIQGTDTLLIITADHGLIDTSKSKTILLSEHPDLYETLTLPLCGEPRVAYCYVHPSKAKKFENYVRKKLSYCCEMYKSEDLIKKGMFGLFKPHNKLFDRIGDYTLIMKENYVINDKLLREREHRLIGNHGGLSKEEMLVPLIVINRL